MLRTEPRFIGSFSGRDMVSSKKSNLRVERYCMGPKQSGPDSGVTCSVEVWASFFWMIHPQELFQISIVIRRCSVAYNLLCARW